jgi:Phage integrase, N-terminal SAM-like domain
MSLLRQRFIDDMRLRNLSPRTIEAYVHGVAKFAKHFGQSPEVLGPVHIRDFQLHLISQNVSWSQFNQSVCALRFLYNNTLRQPLVIEHLPFAKRPRTLPVVLSRDEVARLLAATLPGRERVLLQIAYPCGLRLQELLGIKVDTTFSLPGRGLACLLAREQTHHLAFPRSQVGLGPDRQHRAAYLPADGIACRADQTDSSPHAAAYVRDAVKRDARASRPFESVVNRADRQKAY